MANKKTDSEMVPSSIPPDRTACVAIEKKSDIQCVLI